jgi:hypothetical protein
MGGVAPLPSRPSAPLSARAVSRAVLQPAFLTVDGETRHDPTVTVCPRGWIDRGRLQQDEIEDVHFERPLDPRPDKPWSEYTLTSAKSQAQLVGIEIEMKTTAIPYSGADAFRNWAIRFGHKGIYTSKDPGGFPFELHLDQGTDGKSALLEVVSSPPQTPEALVESLKALKASLPANSKAGKVKAWIEERFDPIFPAEATHDPYTQIMESLKVNGAALYPSLAQITTTHTAKEMKQLNTFPVFKSAQVGSITERKKISVPKPDTQDEWERLDQTIQEDYLKNLKPLEPNSAKGTDPLLKHAYQQFSDGQIAAETLVGRDQPRGLNTFANKPAPLFTRTGTGTEGAGEEIAYVVEYRGKGPVEYEIGKFMQGKIQAAELLEKIKLIYPQNK